MENVRGQCETNISTLNGGVNLVAARANLVAAYTSPYTGIFYIFVVDIQGNNSIIQLKLIANPMGCVGTTFV